MKKSLITILCILLALLICVTGFLVFFSNSPERALLQTIRDFKEDGYSGLRGHLDTKITDKLDKYFLKEKNESENSLLGILQKFKNVDFVQECIDRMMEETEQIDVSLNDIIKGRKRAEVILEITFRKEFTMNVSVVMKKVKGKWLISALDLIDVTDLLFR